MFLRGSHKTHTTQPALSGVSVDNVHPAIVAVNDNIYTTYNIYPPPPDNDRLNSLIPTHTKNTNNQNDRTPQQTHRAIRFIKTLALNSRYDLTQKKQPP